MTVTSKQRIDMRDVTQVYVCYDKSIEFTDSMGNCVSVRTTEDQLTSLRDKLLGKLPLPDDHSVLEGVRRDRDALRAERDSLLLSDEKG